MVIAGGSQYLDDSVADLDDGHIEGAAAEIVYHNLLLFLIVQAVSQRRCCRLVDDTLYIKSGDLAGVLCRLTLCVIEICRAGDDGLCDLFSQIAFRVALQLLQNHCGDLLRSVALAVNGNSVIGAHVTLDR